MTATPTGWSRRARAARRSTSTRGTWPRSGGTRSRSSRARRASRPSSKSRPPARATGPAPRTSRRSRNTSTTRTIWAHRLRHRRHRRGYQHLEYFPFGETWVDEVSDDTRVPYRFTGQEFDQETKLYYHGARYYDPKTSVGRTPGIGAQTAISTRTRPSSLPPTLDNAWRATLNGPGLGGAFEPKNLALASYGAQNPLKYIDPDDVVGNPQKKFGRAFLARRADSISSLQLRNVNAELDSNPHAVPQFRR